MEKVTQRRTARDLIRNIKSRRLRLAEHVARLDESRNAYRVLVGKPEGKIPLGRPRRRWEDNIKMDLREVGYDVNDSPIVKAPIINLFTPTCGETPRCSRMVVESLGKPRVSGGANFLYWWCGGGGGGVCGCGG
ncbi:hypothetical protein ANN_11539 [Periplaneta americana]|uniref:Uncharacterized protein n=1 Tax=Periplaneta americana TaxID=6978 RepID=A0ABQ8T6F3_PERAM|nr:hypothetical protein ANN_11539 [Periplaneta americana]